MVVRLLLFCLPLLLARADNFGITWTLPLPGEMIPFNSSKGVELLLKSSSESESGPFYRAFQHLTTQDRTTVCSIATSVTILNALAGDIAPVDPLYDPYAYWTQSNFINDCTNGIKSYNDIVLEGVTLQELCDIYATCYKAIAANGVRANATSVAHFREQILAAFSQGGYIIVNFYRTELGEVGGGHWSPILAYNAGADMVLLADVARYKYPPAWVNAVSLFDSMMTIDSDSGDYRGYITMKRSTNNSVANKI
jgi:hypothetical protein